MNGTLPISLRKPIYPQVATILLLAAAIFVPAVAGPAAASDQPSPAELVRLTVANEVAADKDTSVKHLFRSRKETGHGSQTRFYVETSDCMAVMVVANDDQPLNAEQLQQEENHLDGLRNSPEQIKHKQAQEKEDAEHTLRIVKALPDAFLYEYAGDQNEAGAIKTANPVVRLKFKPNPDYSPPSRVEQVLTGMKGELWIDEHSRRLLKIDGTLFKDVSFGWSILGHLNPGGHFLVEQADAGDGTWDVTHMSLSFTGKILLFKNLSIKSDEVFSGYQRVPANTTFAQAVDMLKAEEAKFAQDLSGKSAPISNGQAKNLRLEPEKSPH